jgi:hypothetical protein
VPTYLNVTDLEEFEVPWGRWVRLQEVTYAGGLTMLRVRIREGSRFTDLELTPEAAGHLSGRLAAWVESTAGSEADPPTA